MAALKSAKIMLAIGTKFDYYDAVWIKNEWSRYIKMMAEDDTQHLIPCFKNLDAYDIPKEFKNLQALDMAEVTFFKSLMENVNHFIPKAGETKQETYHAAPSATYDSKVQPLLERARMFLEDENFQSADEYCEKVLDLDPKNATAYLYKLMLEYNVTKMEELKGLGAPFDDSDNYKKIERFGDKKINTTLSEYLNEIKERIIEGERSEIYNNGKDFMSQEKYLEALAEFEKIADYKDSSELMEVCKQEQVRVEAEEAERAKANKILRRRENVAGVVITCIAILCAINCILDLLIAGRKSVDEVSDAFNVSLLPLFIGISTCVYAFNINIKQGFIEGFIVSPIQGALYGGVAALIGGIVGGLLTHPFRRKFRKNKAVSESNK